MVRSRITDLTSTGERRTKQNQNKLSIDGIPIPVGSVKNPDNRRQIDIEQGPKTELQQSLQLTGNIDQTISSSNTPQRRINRNSESINTSSFGSPRIIGANENFVPNDPLNEPLFTSEIQNIKSTDGPIENTTTEDLASIGSEILDVAFEANPLSQVDQGIYNFRFFLSSEAATYETIKNENIIIITETGSTGFNITEAKIITIPSPGQKNKNAFATNIQFTIIEPQGNSLFDRMRESARQLGVNDHRNAPYWFEVSFKGYDGSGIDSHSGGDFANLQDHTRLWQILVRTVDVETDQGGTRYTFNCVPFNESGYQDSNRRIERDIKIDAATIGEFIEGLAKQMNEPDTNNTIDFEDVTRRVKKFLFVLPNQNKVQTLIDDVNKTTGSSASRVRLETDMSTWLLRGDNTAKNKRSESWQQVDVKNHTKWRITFPAGTPVEAIIQEVIGSTKEGQAWALHGSQRQATEGTNPEVDRNPNLPAIIFTVDPIIDIIGYNPFAKQYNLLISYNIRPYKTFTGILSRKHINDARNSDQRFQELLKQTGIRKRYEYLYTGLNTEVLDFKIRFDRAWHVMLPIFQGQNRAAHALSSGNMSEEAKTNYKITSRLTQLHNDNISLKAKFDQLSDEIDEASRKLTTNSGDVLVENRLRNTVNQRDGLARQIQQNQDQSDILSARALARGLNNVELTRSEQLQTSTFSANRFIQLQNNIGGQTNQNNNTNIFNLTSNDPNVIGLTQTERELLSRNIRESRTTNSNNKGSIFFIEDFDRASTGRDISKDSNEEIIFLSTEFSPTMNPTEIGIEGTAPKGRSFFSSIMNQIYGLKGDMIQIELEIRGDPYWLGESNPRSRIEETSNRDLSRADSTFIITFNVPLGIDDGNFQTRDDSFAGTGLYNINPVENGFNGVYFVRQIESVFSNGKFTQKLQGVIDPLTKEINTIRIAKQERNRKT